MYCTKMIYVMRLYHCGLGPTLTTQELAYDPPVKMIVGVRSDGDCLLFDIHEAIRRTAVHAQRKVS